MAWSIVSLLTYLAQDYGGMLACRFILGITEAPVSLLSSGDNQGLKLTNPPKFYPGALYLLSIFYTRKEIATRMAVFYTGNMLASSFSGLIAAGVFAGLDGVRGLAGWRWYVHAMGRVHQESH